jgi:hypothetical protein
VRDICNSFPDHSHDQFISLGHIRRMARIIEKEEIHLHEEDAISSKLWMHRLQADEIHTFYKDKTDPSPFGSNLDEGAFVMCIQTPSQVDTFQRLGGGFIGIDATHNMQTSFYL